MADTTITHMLDTSLPKNASEEVVVAGTVDVDSVPSADVPAAPSTPQYNRTVDDAAPEATPTMRNAYSGTTQYIRYKVSCEPQAGCTSFEITFFAGDGTSTAVVDTLAYIGASAIDTSVAPYDEGWSKEVYCRSDRQVGVMVAPTGGDVIVYEVLQV